MSLSNRARWEDFPTSDDVSSFPQFPQIYQEVSWFPVCFATIWPRLVSIRQNREHRREFQHFLFVLFPHSSSHIYLPNYLWDGSISVDSVVSAQDSVQRVRVENIDTNCHCNSYMVMSISSTFLPTSF